VCKVLSDLSKGMIEAALYVLNCSGDNGTSSIRISYLFGPMPFVLMGWVPTEVFAT